MDLCSTTLAHCFLPDDHKDKYDGPLPSLHEGMFCYTWFCIEYLKPIPVVSGKNEGMLQMVSGLEYLHLRDLIHRNLKPNNILVFSTSKSVQFKLSDVGQTKNYLSVWMAPELLNKCRDDPPSISNCMFNAASDVWSLGCIFYYFLTKGSHPFKDCSMVETLLRIVEGRPCFSPGTYHFQLVVHC